MAASKLNNMFYNFSIQINGDVLSQHPRCIPLRQGQTKVQATVLIAIVIINGSSHIPFKFVGFGKAKSRSSKRLSHKLQTMSHKTPKLDSHGSKRRAMSFEVVFLFVIFVWIPLPQWIGLKSRINYRSVKLDYS